MLSRYISSLITAGSLSLIKDPNSVQVPSHVFYADDVLIFCEGSLANLHILVFGFDSYATIYGQGVSCGKSFIYGGTMSQTWLKLLSSLTGFTIGSSSFVYLRVPIFKGNPCAKFLLPIAGKVIIKLDSWKGFLLSFAGRVELVKSSIQSMLIHSMFVYSWLVSL